MLAHHLSISYNNTRSSIIPRDNLNGEILRPHRLINTITPCADMIFQLEPARKPRDGLRSDESRREVLGFHGLEEAWVEQGFGVMARQELQHGWQQIRHGMVVAEGRRSVPFPYLLPDLVAVGSA